MRCAHILFYASNAGGLAHVRSLQAKTHTAEIPGQVRNDEKEVAFGETFFVN